MLRLKTMLPAEWQEILNAEFEQDYFRQLEAFLELEMAEHTVFPSREDIFAAFHLTPPDKVRVLLLGQDPYHDHGQAQGLCFSVPDGVKLPPSLRNMYKEMASDLNIAPPAGGSLKFWAAQGVLLLNTCLTVRAHEAASHSKKGWEQFTDAVIAAVNARSVPTVFVLWGNHAAGKEKLIDQSRHHIHKSAHPSPLSASRGFLGSRPYSRINELLRQSGHPAIEWVPAAVVPEAQMEFKF